MIPAKTREALGSSLWQTKVCEPNDYYGVIGNDLNELKALALRLNERLDANEARDWQNRINLMIDQAVRNGVVA
jgi:hypothetical protein